VRATGSKIVALLMGVTYAFVYNLISPYIGPRSDDGDDPSGGAGSTIQSFYDSLSTFEILLIAVPAVAGLSLLVLWIAARWATTPRRILTWLNATTSGQTVFFATIALMCFGIGVIFVQELRLY
jgi:hypothetical protein